jgi:hypothetical protein
MSHLQGLAHASGKAVVAAIHQPRSAIWSLFDKVRHRAAGQFITGCRYSVQIQRNLVTGIPLVAPQNLEQQGDCRLSAAGLNTSRQSCHVTAAELSGLLARP